MAMTNIQLKIAQAMQDLIAHELELKSKREIILAMFLLEGMATLTDADYQAYPDFAHITAIEALAAKNAEIAIATTVGVFENGANAQKLLRFLGKVPEGL